ncbi:hypothetical protein JZ751_021547 [Albula glossodonta]|uniref:Uncharacterized protein n=1 Tax=Albula glossodonta TaxID=121402 RepID=A0A8T2NK72_9TELE|nr:hypothetical protein JZ751_021547 [Albula glossodonta]
METSERKLSVMSRPQLVERLVDDILCETASFQKHSDLPDDKFTVACKHLLDVHGEDFRDALLRRESERLDVLLCYQSSLACVGVKRHANQNKASFKDSDIENLLEENRENIRITRPVHTNFTKMDKDEL